MKNEFYALLVDDDLDFLEMISKSFEKKGIQCLKTNNISEALQWVQSTPIFAIVSDYHIGDYSGLDFCEKVRDEKPLLPFFLITGFPESQIAAEGVKRGVSQYFEKPLDIKSLSQKLLQAKEAWEESFKLEQEEMLALRKVFSQEANDMFNDIESWILKLEESPKNLSALNILFRKAHTVKGSAGSFEGTEDLRKVVHIFETVLGELKKDDITITPIIIDALLHTSDVIKQLIKCFEEGSSHTFDVESEVYLLSHALERNTKGLTTDTPAPTPESKTPIEPKSPPPHPAGDMDEDQGVFVSNERLLGLMEQAGELVVFKNALQNAVREVLSVNENMNFKHMLEDLSHSIDKISEGIHDQVISIRKVSLDVAFAKFPRMVRQLNQELKKKIKLEMFGSNIGVDKSIAKALTSCVVHLVRNSADHGIELPEIRKEKNKNEQGTITIICQEEGDYLNLTISDDGAGIPKEKVLKKAISIGLVSEMDAFQLSDEKIFDLLFMAGFSTAEKISDVSGRGVGMDVVKTEIEKLRGTIRIESAPNMGTTMRIRLPAMRTVMVETSIVAKVDENLLAIPLEDIAQITTSAEHELSSVQGIQTIQFRGKTIPVGNFTDFVGDSHWLPSSENKLSGELIVIIKHKGGEIGLRVDQVLDHMEAVIRPFDNIIQSISGFKGTSVVSNDKIAFVLSAESMVNELIARELGQ